MYKLITILGPTATGKTSLASQLAFAKNGEIISADSRQVYKEMNIGTGKDLNEYVINKKNIPYHLIDIHNCGYEYNVFEFQDDFQKAYKQIIENKHLPILCGGTGLYIDAVLKGYKLIPVPPNNELRAELEQKEHDELIQLLSGKTSMHNTTDTSSKKRTIRALEISLYCEENNIIETVYPKMDTVIFGINLDRPIVREKITERLKKRFEEGMINEVKNLIQQGISIDKLKFYGLEYKFIAQYVNNELNYNDMFQKLNTAIHQFAKRQMTWFRRMEKQGTKINWINGELTVEEKLEAIYHIAKI